MSDWLRPRLHLDPDTPIAHADLSPFGVNVFLEQEADPAKRALAVEMAADAGYDWLRQEFPWEDIEIHGKGDFEDRRHEPYRSAWEKYDHIVDLAEEHDLEMIVRLSNPPAWSRAAGDEIGTYAPPDDCGRLRRLCPRRSRSAIRVASAIISSGMSRIFILNGANGPSIPRPMWRCSKPAQRPSARSIPTP